MQKCRRLAVALSQALGVVIRQTASSECQLTGIKGLLTLRAEHGYEYKKQRRLNFSLACLAALAGFGLLFRRALVANSSR